MVKDKAQTFIHFVLLPIPPLTVIPVAAWLLLQLLVGVEECCVLLRDCKFPTSFCYHSEERGYVTEK